MSGELFIMTTTEMQLSDDSDVFKIIESYDEKQILDIADFEHNNKLVYEVQGKKELSYNGIKHLTIIMAQNNNPLKTMPDSKLELFGEGNEKIWYSTVNVVNQRTGQTEQGVSQCPFYDNAGKVDHFARTKAHSKAERNAKRKHIPEALITQMINDSQKTKSTTTTKPPTKSNQLCSCLVPKPNPTDNQQCINCRKAITSN